MTWAKEISEGAMWGPQPTRVRPGGLCPPGAPPSDVICTKNLNIQKKKNRIKVSRYYENFYFLVIFHCTESSENRQDMTFYFI